MLNPKLVEISIPSAKTDNVKQPGKDTLAGSGVGMGIISTIIDVLEGIANIWGLGNVVRKVAKYADGGEANFSYSDLTTIINTLTTAAKRKGEKYVTQLNEKLNSMPVGTTGKLRSIVQNARQKLKKQLVNYSSNAKMAEVAEENARNAALDISNMSSGQILTGEAANKRKEMESWAKQAADFLDKGTQSENDLTKTVEERIN